VALAALQAPPYQDVDLTPPCVRLSLLGRTSQPFWQAEAYDHSVRLRSESDYIQAYIENNSMKAGLVANAEDYLWSSAARKAEKNLGSAGWTACATMEAEPTDDPAGAL
jgi:hypothetical protein